LPFDNALERLGLSARGCDKVLRIARTIDHADTIRDDYLGERIQFRSQEHKERC